MTLASSILRFGSISVDLASARIHSTTGESPLGPRDVALLSYLAERAGQVVPRDELLVAVWGYSPNALTRTVDIAVSRLQKKIEPQPYNPRYLLTIHGSGYRLELPGDPLAVGRTGDLVGRQAELEQILAWARADGDPGLVVVGFGGMGKSRLVQAALSQLGADWRGLVHFVSLGRHRGEAPLLDVILGALGGEDEDSAVLPRLAARLGGGPVLLVLDELEHFLGESAPLLELLAACPALKLLATSRADPGVAGLRTLELGGLSPMEAWALLLDRSPQGAPWRQDEATLEALTLACGHVPLVIELAAAALRHRPPEALLALLGTRIDGLADPDHAGPAHHRSVRACLDQSLGLLEPRHRSALVRLAQFRGPFDEPMAAEVTRVDAETLGELVAWSLVRWVDGGFRLHPLVHAYAAKALPEQDPGIPGRYREWFLRWASGLSAYLTTRERGAAMSRLRCYGSDLLLALELSVEDGDIDGLATLDANVWSSFTSAGLAHAVEPILRRACDTGQAPWRLHLARGELLAERGDQAGAGRVLDALLADPLPTEHARALALAARAQVHARTREDDRAMELATAACEAAEQAGDIVAIYKANLTRANIPRQRSLDPAQRAVEAARAWGNPEATTEALCTLGALHYEQEAYDLALGFLSQADALAESMDDAGLRGLTQGLLGNVYRRTGRLAEAAKAYRSSVAFSRQVGRIRGVWAHTHNLALVLRDQGEAEEAERLLRGALELAVRSQQARQVRVTLVALGSLEIARRQPSEARAWFAAAVEQFRGAPGDDDTDARWGLAMAAWRVGDLATAEEQLDVVGRRPLALSPTYRGLLLLSGAVLLATRGDPGAVAAVGAGLDAAPTNIPTAFARCLTYAAWALARVGHLAPAREVLACALAAGPTGFWLQLVEECEAWLGGLPAPSAGAPGELLAAAVAAAERALVQVEPVAVEPGG